MSRLIVMAVGDSITVGTNSTALGGYRYGIYENRNFQGFPYVSRGTTEAGNIGEKRMTGNSGERTDEVLARLQADAHTFAPDVVLYHCGTNDCTQRNSGVAPPPTEAQSVQYVMDTLDLFRAANPKMYVLVAYIIPNQNAGADAQITSYNAALRTAILLRSDYTAGYVVPVDMNAAFRANSTWSADYMGDATHPNAVGYSVMLSQWIAALNTLGF